MKGSILIETQNYIAEAGLKNSSANLAEKGDIIIGTRMNPGRPIISQIRTAINSFKAIMETLNGNRAE